MFCVWIYDNDDEYLEFINENKKKNLKFILGIFVEYCKEELNFGL